MRKLTDKQLEFIMYKFNGGACTGASCRRCILVKLHTYSVVMGSPCDELARITLASVTPEKILEHLI